MNVLLNSPDAYTLIRAKELLREKISALSGNLHRDRPLIRFEIKIHSQSILDWPAGQELTPRFFWAEREKQFRLAGIGAAHSISQNQIDYLLLFHSLRQNLSEEFPYAHYYGGMAFDSQNLGPEWNDFGACRFWLPRFEMFQTKAGTFLACNLIVNDKNGDPQNFIHPTLNDLELLRVEDSEHSASLPRALERSDSPDHELWSTLVQEALNAIATGNLEKVVLARKSLLKLDRALNPFLFLKEVEKITKDCFHFCFQPGNGTAFVGASPERLYRSEEHTSELQSQR